MSKFSPEEISLCKKVAEKYWKPVKHGDWYCYTNYADENTLSIYLPDNQYEMPVYDRCVPLWTISDCLEFLRGKCQYHVILSHDEEDEKEWFLWVDEYKKTQQMGSGKTPLEALLKAVLAVLEEKE